jgi:hypothetical protein
MTKEEVCTAFDQLYLEWSTTTHVRTWRENHWMSLLAQAYKAIRSPRGQYDDLLGQIDNELTNEGIEH